MLKPREVPPHFPTNITVCTGYEKRRVRARRRKLEAGYGNYIDQKVSQKYCGTHHVAMPAGREIKSTRKVPRSRATQHACYDRGEVAIAVFSLRFLHLEA